jgi:hypothetical protein
VQSFDHIAIYGRRYRALSGRKASPWFVQKMRASIREIAWRCAQRASAIFKEKERSS